MFRKWKWTIWSIMMVQVKTKFILFKDTFDFWIIKERKSVGGLFFLFQHNDADLLFWSGCIATGLGLFLNLFGLLI